VAASKFLSLPRELRNVIYAYALNDVYAAHRETAELPSTTSNAQRQHLDTSTHSLMLDPVSDKFGPLPAFVKQRKDYVALGQVCRQIREEYRSLDATTDFFALVCCIEVGSRFLAGCIM
jgi:hypothetical protein